MNDGNTHDQCSCAALKRCVCLAKFISPDTELDFCGAKNIQDLKMKKFPIPDGTTEKLMCDRSTLSIEFSDWQEQLWLITFHKLIAFQGIGAIGSEISEMYEPLTCLSQ